MSKTYKKKNNIDLGLAVLSVYVNPGEAVSVAVMADVCECSVQTISDLINKALGKLKKNISLYDHLEPL